jgi:hypothetical protein
LGKGFWCYAGMRERTRANSFLLANHLGCAAVCFCSLRCITRSACRTRRRPASYPVTDSLQGQGGQASKAVSFNSLSL